MTVLPQVHNAFLHLISIYQHQSQKTDIDDHLQWLVRHDFQEAFA